MVPLWSFLLVSTWLLKTGPVLGCICPSATVLTRFPSEIPVGACCLNYSGSAFRHVRWSVFTNGTSVETLDLSNCNISLIDAEGGEATALRRVYLNRNRLETLPLQFLAGQPNLTEVNLSQNFLQELPEGFLQDSCSLKGLHLRRNQLRTLPDSVLYLPGLQVLDLDENQWDCSCLLLEDLEAGGGANRTIRLYDLVVNLTCSSPRHLHGRTVWSLRLDDVCRPAGLTALFIALPLLILSALLLCWCCGRKRRKKKETPAFSTSKKRAASSAFNGHKHPNKPPASALELDRGKGGILKNKALHCPESDLLDGSRDGVYEEVEVKLSSVESLPQLSSRRSSSTEEKAANQELDGTDKAELDTVSVTEVMKDSADREKAYLTQSTEYYNLVPGIELEDWDHGEYESVNHS